jgi:uncharacterized protein YfdQ (DUF2303 family)
VTQHNSAVENSDTVGALVEDLTRRSEAATATEPYTLSEDTSVIIRTHRNDEHLTTVNLERWLPAPDRPRGDALVFDPSDFIAYVNRLAGYSTTVWGHEKATSFTAVFNDHEGAFGAGWRDHTAKLQLQNDPDWAAFLAKDGEWFGQVAFSDFLQDYQATFVEPDGATLLEIATSFKAHRKAEYSSAINTSNGDVQLTYNESTKTVTKAGQIDVPASFVVRLSPFLGMPPVNLGARLKWSLDDGQLRLGFKLVRPDLVRRDAFADICANIRDGVKDAGATVLLGSAPQPVTPQS